MSAVFKDIRSLQGAVYTSFSEIRCLEKTIEHSGLNDFLVSSYYKECTMRSAHLTLTQSLLSKF